MSETTSSVSARPRIGPAFAGAAATLSGVGLSRFAYVPLFPAMVSAGWISGAEGGLLGALNLAGYLAGVLGGRSLAGRIGTAFALDAGMALAALAFAGCAIHIGVAWLAWWRFVAGVAGGVLMALAGPAVQGAVDPGRRGVAGGIVLAGVSAGVLIGSGSVALTLPLGVSASWLALALLVVLLWAAVRPSWPTTPISLPQAGTPARALVLHLAYGISGAGLVPHMVYFADFVVRGRGYPPNFGSALWLVFGFGMLSGALAAGRAADRFGPLPGLRVWLGLQVVALAAPLATGLAPLVVSAFLGGFSALGLSAIALARARELAGEAAGAIWVRATAAFAVAQAVTGFALAALFKQAGSHEPVFTAGLALSALALLVSFSGADRPSRTH